MSGAIISQVRALIEEADVVYGDDPAALDAVGSHARRLEEPLRIAVAGMVKAGKSTLLNAIIGADVAPTDNGECTRIITWYRYRDTPSVTLHPINGEPRALSFTQVDGRLSFDIGQIRADEVKRLVVDWPAARLKDITLIDTPGIASLSREVSARSTDFLTPRDASPEADAIIYVTRRLHAADLTFLESFRSAAVGPSRIVNALAVLSRADEIGAGRIDSLLSASEIAKRYRRDNALRALALGIIPVAGLLAQSASNLHPAELTALIKLSELDRGERERLLLSADRFTRPAEQVRISAEDRKKLLDRLGLFGVRLAVVLIRSGITEVTALERELARRSGVSELQRLIDLQFYARAEHLKARTALVGIETLLRARPRPGTDRLAASLERIQSSAHEFTELRLLAALRTTGLAVEPQHTAEVERLIGGQGLTPADRLGVARNTSTVDLQSEALASLRRWRTLADNPLTTRAALEVCRCVVRSCEGILAHEQARAGSGGRVTARLVLAPEPRLRPGKHARDQPRAG